MKPELLSGALCWMGISPWCCVSSLIKTGTHASQSHIQSFYSSVQFIVNTASQTQIHSHGVNINNKWWKYHNFCYLHENVFSSSVASNWAAVMWLLSENPVAFHLLQQQSWFGFRGYFAHLVGCDLFSNGGSVWSHSGAAGPCVRVKDSRTKALQMGQCWKCDTQLSHTQACLQGSSTLFTAAFWHTTQSLPLPSDQSSSSSSSSSSTELCSTLLASLMGSMGGLLCSESGRPDAPPLSADMKRGCRRQKDMVFSQAHVYSICAIKTFQWATISNIDYWLS